MKLKETSRRIFLKNIAMTGALAPLLSNFSSPAFSQSLQEPKKFPISIFSKHLEWLNYEQTAETAKKIGFDGIDFSVRPKGHVLPENVKKDLPKAVRAAEKQGLKVNMITTAITSATEKHTENILKTAADLGIQFYRMGYVKYEPSRKIPENLDHYKKEFGRLAEMNEKFNIHGAYQNHSGTNVGAAVWDLYLILKDLDPEWMGVQYDIRHAVVEGGFSWPIGLQLLSPWIKFMAIKDFEWNKEDKQQIKNVPLGKGIVDFKHFFELLKQENIEGPISLHYEYPYLSKSEESWAVEKKITKVSPIFKDDLNTLQRYLTS